MRSLEFIYAVSSFREPGDVFHALVAGRSLSTADVAVALDVALRAGRLDPRRARALLEALRAVAIAQSTTEAFDNDDIEVDGLIRQREETEERRKALVASDPDAAPLRARMFVLEDHKRELGRELAAIKAELETIAKSAERADQIRRELHP